MTGRNDRGVLSRRQFLKMAGMAGGSLLLPPLGMAAADSKPFSIIVLPDTQCYADTRIGYAASHWGNGDLRETFFRQTAWIKEQKDALNIAMVAHVGDIVQTDYDKEWAIADKAFRTLDGVVPYCLCLGNHDMGFAPNPAEPEHFHTAMNRKTRFNHYFGPERFAGRPWYGERFASGNDNYYCHFEAGGMRFLIVSLEFKPRSEAVAWADEVVSRHPKHRVIVLTHAYLTPDSVRAAAIDYPVEGLAAEAMWQDFVSRHANIFLVVCGHYCREGRLASLGKSGNQVHQILSDYQDMHNGGDGFLRIMTFDLAQDAIAVKTYSPVTGKYLTGPASQFTLPYAMKIVA